MMLIRVVNNFARKQERGHHRINMIKWCSTRRSDFDLALYDNKSCWMMLLCACTPLYVRAYNRLGYMLIVRKHAAKPIAIHALSELQADNAAPGN